MWERKKCFWTHYAPFLTFLSSSFPFLIKTPKTFLKSPVLKLLITSTIIALLRFLKWNWLISHTVQISRLFNRKHNYFLPSGLFVITCKHAFLLTMLACCRIEASARNSQYCKTKRKISFGSFLYSLNNSDKHSWSVISTFSTVALNTECPPSWSFRNNKNKKRGDSLLTHGRPYLYNFLLRYTFFPLKLVNWVWPTGH